MRSFSTGRYLVRRLLGEGSRKRVYLAHDTALDRDVALALIKSEGLDAAALARVRSEAQVMGRLGDHPHIVAVYDVGEDSGRPFIVSQFMAGGSLDEALRGEGARYGDTEGSNGEPDTRSIDPSSPRPLTLEETFRIADQICRALEHAHAHGVIHRDLKPANVWLTADGTAKLGDFGLALSRDRSRVTVEGLMVGTVAYMAPEQAIGKTVDARSDLYALGALLYEVVTGRPPFVGDDAVAVISQHLHTAPVAPSWHNQAVPHALDALILQLLQKDPAKRPASAAEVRKCLAAIGTQNTEDRTQTQRDGAGEPGHRSLVTDHSAVANPLDRLDAGVFVGREKEMTALRAAVEDALAGRGRVVLIAGEPGIGKTRVAQELATYAQLRGMQVLWGRCHEGGGAPAYWPWVQAIRTYVYERSPQELRAEMGAGAPDIANVVSAVRERLPDLPAPPRLEPEQERFRLFDSVTTFLTRAASQRAIMFVVDDLHWADAPSLLLLQFLARELESGRMVVVATYRDEEAQPERPLFVSLAELARTPASRRMALAGLREPEIAQLIERAAGQRPSAGLITAVARQTEGNPFFVGEVVRWLVAQGPLEQTATAAIGVPPSVREVIGRRLQRLSPACNELLISAAVVGRDFPLALLARVRGQSQDALLELAEEAVGARVLAEGSEEVGRYSFMHALIRETLYADLSGARRRRLHQQIGEALESLHATRLDHHLPALAYHFSEAASSETGEKAIMYAQRAGDRAMTLTAYEDAATYYQRVLHALDTEGDEGRRAEVLLRLGKAEFACGKPLAEVRARYLQTAAIARQLDAPDLLARAALEFSTGPLLPGVVDETRSQLLEEAKEVLAGHDTLLHARVLARFAHVAERSGVPERVAALCDEAVVIARRHGDPDTLAFVLWNAACAQLRPDHFPRSLAWLKELSALSKRIENRRPTSDLHLLGIIMFSRLGDRASLDSAADGYIAVAEELRLSYYLQVAHQVSAMRATISGRFTDAERHAQAALACGGTIHHELAQQIFGGLIFAVRLEQGRLGDLEGAFASTVNRLPHVAIWRAGLAWIYSELGRTEDARCEFDRLAAHDFADVPVEPYYWLATIGVLAEVCAALGDARRARVLYDILLPYADMCAVLGDAVICFGATARHLGRLAATMRRWDDASRHFEKALAINTRMGAPPLVARTQYSYASMLLERDAPGDRAKASELLNAATDTAQQLGMKALFENALALKLRLQGVERSGTTTSLDAVATAIALERPDLDAGEAPALPAPRSAVLRQEDAFWTLSYEGTTSRLKDMKGLHYLAELLRSPGREFHALDLVQGTGSEDERPTTRSEGLEILDPKAKGAYRRRLAELREDLQEAEEFNDTGRAERARGEIEAISEQLSAAVGLGGRNRVAGGSAERARSTVTKRIKDVLKRIGEINAPLGDHFATRVKTGTFCVYIPDAVRPITWQLE